MKAAASCPRLSISRCCGVRLLPCAALRKSTAWRYREHQGNLCSTSAVSVNSKPALRGNLGARHKSQAAAGDSQGSDVVYEGMYGQWRIEQEDIMEVWSYRIGLTVAVAACTTAALICSTSDTSASLHDSPAAAFLNPLSLLAAAAFGVSLVQIHIYMAPVKKTLQLLLGLGVAGGLYLSVSHPEVPLPLFVAENPWSVWFVGPAAAAVTGVAIKEGICYGKPEAAALAALMPLLCLTHLSGLAPAEIERGLLAAVCLVAAVFAGRKYSQAIKDDIGDKSVFVYLKQQQQQQQE